MSGIGVALGANTAKQKIKKPEACEKCQKRPCSPACLDRDAYMRWEASQKSK